MADITYPQRWLKEHQAVTSPEGWRRPTTQELLKCQKGLIPPAQLTLVSILDVPSTVELDANGAASFTIGYSWLEAGYTPTTIDLVINKLNNVSNVVTYTKLADNKIKVDVTNAVAEDQIKLTINIDNTASTSPTVTFKNDVA